MKLFYYFKLILIDFVPIGIIGILFYNGWISEQLPMLNFFAMLLGYIAVVPIYLAAIGSYCLVFKNRPSRINYVITIGISVIAMIYAIDISNGPFEIWKFFLGFGGLDIEEAGVITIESALGILILLLGYLFFIALFKSRKKRGQ